MGFVSSIVEFPFVFFGFLAIRRLVRGAPRGEHLSTRSRLFVESLSTGPSASRNTFSVSTITDGYARAGSRSSYLPLRRPHCTLSRLRAEEYDRPVTQSIATLRHGDTKACLNSPSGIGGGGNDTGRLVTWDCPLRTDSAS